MLDARRRNPQRPHRGPAGRRPLPGRRQRQPGPRMVHAPPRRTTCRSATSPPGTCCIGLWGPQARDLLQPLTRTDSRRGMRYFTGRETYRRQRAGDRASTVLCGRTGLGAVHDAPIWAARCGTCCGRPGSALGVVAAGRSAFNSMRLEKGYRSWGADMTTEHDPYEAGLGFAVRMDKGDFIGRDALAGRTPPAAADLPDHGDPHAVVLGSEPVLCAGARGRLRDQCRLRLHHRQEHRLRLAAGGLRGRRWTSSTSDSGCRPSCPTNRCSIPT